MFFGMGNRQLNRVQGGKKLTLTCLSCHKKAPFYECRIDDNFKLYAVLEVWKRTKRVLQCGECLAVSDYYDVFPEEKDLAEQAVSQRKQQEAEAKAKVAQEEEKQRKRQEELEAKQREERVRQKDLEVQDELAKLKKKLGK
jgi:hypothetical protein